LLLVERCAFLERKNALIINKGSALLVNMCRALLLEKRSDILVENSGAWIVREVFSFRQK